MRSFPIHLQGVALLLPWAVTGITVPFLDVCKVVEVLEYFSCLRPVPRGCVENLKEQANAFCSSYLSIEPVTTYLSTVTPEPSVTTVTEYATVSRTSVDYVWTIVPTTVTTVETSTALETVTTTVTAATGGLPPSKRNNAAAVTALPHCPDLTKKLAGKPAWKLSKACSCLDPEPTTITISATSAAPEEPITVTEPVTSTVVVIEISTSTEVSTVLITEGTVVTETATATFTTSPSPAPTCAPPGGSCTIDNFVTACCKAADGSVGCYFPSGDPYDGICFN